MKPLRFAILYWFYTQPEVTRNHLEIARHHNPDANIYGLFGGRADQAREYRDLLAGLLDDFWLYPETYGPEKWRNGDLLLLDWYDRRGRHLEWDCIATIQWDMLLFGAVQDLTPGLRQDQLFFSGYRDLDDALELRWDWTRPSGPHRETLPALPTLPRRPPRLPSATEMLCLSVCDTDAAILQ